MLKMTIDELIHATGAELVAGSPKHTFEGCVIDSRKAQEGSLFVAFKGEKVDGNLYVAKALEAGAACAVVTEEPKEDALAYARKGGCAIVRAAHDDPEEFMLRLATAWRQKHPDWIVCGLSADKKYVALYPTDVQFDPSDSQQAAEYSELMEYFSHMDYESELGDNIFKTIE